MNIPHILNWRSASIALIISLLLHIGMVLYIALEKSGFQLPFLQKQEDLERLPEEKKYTKDTEWAETKGRSSYGAPVLFRDEPDDEVMPDFTQPSDDTQDALHDTANEETIDQNESMEQSDNQPQANQTTQEKKQTEELVEEKLDIKSSVAEAMKNKQDTTSIQTIVPQQPLPQNKPTLSKSMQNAPQITRQQSHSTPPSRTGLSAVALAKEGKPIAMTKKTPSLAQLTQGVLNYVKDEGQYAVSMIGKKGGVPSDEQMKYERFLQKLGHCLQTTFSINNDKFPQCDPSVSSIEIFLALNKDGTLHNLRLVKTSGDPRVDSFMMFAFRDASSSFPTVPHYLPHNPFSITYVVDISPTRSNMGIYRR